MAVNVSTNVSVCVYCKTTSNSDTEKEFHEIFDEVGLELQLPTLVKNIFHLKFKNNKQLLCDDCLNRLIELYDLAEYDKCEKLGSAVVHLENPEKAIKSKIVDKGQSNENAKRNCENVTKEIAGIKNALKIKDNHKQLIVFETHFNSIATPKGGLSIENSNDVSNNSCNVKLISKNDNTRGNVKIINDRNHESVDKITAIVENDGHESQEAKQLEKNTSTSFLKKPIIIVSEAKEHEQVIDSYVDYDTVTEIIDAEISCEEFHIIDDYQSEESVDFKVEAVTKSKTSQIDYICTDENEFIEEHVSEEETLLDSNTKIAEEGVYKKLTLTELNVDNEDEADFYQEEDFESIQDNDNIDELTADQMENDNIELKSFKQENENFLEIDSESSNYVVAESEISRDTGDRDLEDVNYTIDEEYLVEEICCSQEYDNVDLNEYLDKSLITKFENLELNWKVECNHCFETYNTLQELLLHLCITQLLEEQQSCCIVKNCEEKLTDLQSLARHLVLQHYDKLESTNIYGRCPDCEKSFSNFIEFNKHSCCRTIKKRTGARNFCQTCNIDFQSLKRYVFHMQFHLTMHRPKVCLLCNASFNNSNEFFEHTQYSHEPNSAMACIKCDRFFKDKEVYNNHMDSHKDSKYQFACTYCPKEYTNKHGLNLHMDIYHNHKSKPMQCEYCEKEFVNNSSYRNHMKSHVPDTQIETCICSVCGLISNNFDLLKDHTESDEKSPCYSAEILEEILSLGYTCENCSLDFHTLKHLKQHRLTTSHNDKLFSCCICRRVFKTLRQMRNHAINHKEFEQWQETFPITRYFVCNIGECQEFYSLWTSLYYHKKRPHKTADYKESILKFKCEFCQQLCTSKMSLAVHIARSHNNSNIRCSYCKQLYKTERMLVEHIDKFHTAVRCKYCFKDFKNRRNLESHNHLVHLNEKRFFCKHCPKGYFYKSERNAHEKTVHPDIAYKCDICNFVTNYPKSLEIHMDKHNNQLKFQCTICTKSFGRKQLLTVHMRRHANKKDYVCTDYLTEGGCSASFITYNLMKTHIKNKHQNYNMQKVGAKRKRPSKKYQVVQIANDSNDLQDENDNDNDDDNDNEGDSSNKVKLCKRTSGIQIKDVESDNDSIEFILADDIIPELKSDNEYIIQCDDDILSNSE